MVERATTARAEAVREFAASLRGLRASAGTPSFREMSGRSQAISHTTLHEAAQGLRLPSWATTVEFVRACGADPADYRTRWERADAAVRGAAESERVTPPAPVDPPVAAPPTVAAPAAVVPEVAAPPAVVPAVVVSPAVAPAAIEPAPETDPDIRDGSTVAPPPRRRRTLAVVGTGVVALAAVVAGVLVTTAGDSDSSPGSPPPVLTAADCPVKQTNPPPAGPATAGDEAAFVTDITLPDCSVVERGATVVKTWRFRNVGTVAWTGYTLHRVDLPENRDQCQTIADTAIADTAPGEFVDISVTVTAPQRATFCFVRFKVEDAAGRLAFPAARPVNFQIVVE